jgi:hypothetical protein
MLPREIDYITLANVVTLKNFYISFELVHVKEIKAQETKFWGLIRGLSYEEQLDILESVPNEFWGTNPYLTMLASHRVESHCNYLRANLKERRYG